MFSIDNEITREQRDEQVEAYYFGGGELISEEQYEEQMVEAFYNDLFYQY